MALDTELTSVEIGIRLEQLRKKRGLSQAELAEQVSLPRTSIVQLEAGKRQVSLIEIQRFSKTLTFSIDEFIATNFMATQLDSFTLNDSESTFERISIPILSSDKLKDTILYVLEKVAGKPNVDEQALHLLLYLCDFNYYELYEEHLSGIQYHKMNDLPQIQSFDGMLEQLIHLEAVVRVKTKMPQGIVFRLLPLAKPNLQNLKASETALIDQVLEAYGDWAYAALSHYIAQDLPIKVSKVNQVIDYEMAFYRELPYSSRGYCKN